MRCMARRFRKQISEKWFCPECGLNVRMGIVPDPMLRHHPCEEAVSRPLFLIPGDVYVAKEFMITKGGKDDSLKLIG
jgi:hypothetical protein